MASNGKISILSKSVKWLKNVEVPKISQNGPHGPIFRMVSNGYDGQKFVSDIICQMTQNGKNSLAGPKLVHNWSKSESSLKWSKIVKRLIRWNLAYETIQT